jgi:lysozyme family protein
MTDIGALKSRNRVRWSNAKITRGPEFDRVAKRLVASKDRYKSVERRTGVPWFIIAVIHEREASQNWNTQLGQGDPLTQRSVHVPKGRGPFPTWEDGAYDALALVPAVRCKVARLVAGRRADAVGRIQWAGYANKGLPSPYVWAGTDQYVKGKYVSDGVFDPNAVDRQLGCAGLILAMAKLDPSVSFGDTAIPPPPDIPAPKPAPLIHQFSRGNNVFNKLRERLKGWKTVVGTHSSASPPSSWWASTKSKPSTLRNI